MLSRIHDIKTINPTRGNAFKLNGYFGRMASAINKKMHEQWQNELAEERAKQEQLQKEIDAIYLTLK